MASRRDFKPAKDPRGGHMRIYWDMFDSAAWACLSDCSRNAYLALLRQKNSSNNGDLSLPLSKARHYGISADKTLVKALRELCAVGFIAPTRKGGSGKDGRRQTNLFRFTDTEVYAMPLKFIEACKATNDWKEVKSIPMGKALIRDFIAAAIEEERARKEAERARKEAEQARKTKSLLEKVQQTPGESPVFEPRTSGKSTDGGPRPMEKVKTARAPPNDKKPEPTTA